MRRALALLLAGCLWLTALSAATAQGLNDIPSPDEIRTQTRELRVDWPASGEVVKVPFTVTGVAAPGARLELWLGGELERKFIADANGRFNTAVSKEADELEIRHVGTDGKPLASVELSVVFAGAAPAVAATEKATADPTPTSSESTPPTPDAIDPFATAEPTPTGLPRVSELDGGSSSNTAPVPPPPSSTSSSFAPEEAPAAIGQPAEEIDLQAPPAPRKRTPSRSARYFAEAGVGLGSGLVIGFGGAILGGAIGLAASDGFAAIGLAVIGGMAGAVVGVPLGVILTGNAMDGNGRWWAVILGEVVGIATATSMTALYANNFYDGTVPALLFALLPPLGAAAGYELSSDPSAQDAEAGLRARLSPAIGRSQDGGMTFGLQLRF